MAWIIILMPYLTSWLESFGRRLCVPFFALAIALLAAGCSVRSWDADATEGRHHTTWNHGLEISVSGFGLYIGPGRNSQTVIDNGFKARAEGPTNAEAEAEAEPID